MIKDCEKCIHFSSYSTINGGVICPLYGIVYFGGKLCNQYIEVM